MFLRAAIEIMDQRNARHTPRTKVCVQRPVIDRGSHSSLRPYYMCPQPELLIGRKSTVPLGSLVGHSSRYSYPPPTHYCCLNPVRQETPTPPPFFPSSLQEDPSIKTTESRRPFFTSQKAVTSPPFCRLDAPLPQQSAWGIDQQLCPTL